MRYISLLLICVTLFPFAAIGQTQSPGAATNSPAPSASPNPDIPPLAELVTACIQADERKAQRTALEKLKAHPEYNFDAVAKTFSGLKLWKAQESGLIEFPMTDERGRKSPYGTMLHVIVPKGYDPERAYPMLLALPDAEQSGETFAKLLGSLLGPRRDDYIIVAITDLRGLWWSDDPSTADQPRAVLSKLKHRYHIDGNRVYLIGYGNGGHAVSTFAMLHADQFAGAMALAGAFAPDFGPEAIDTLLGNLKNLPTYLIYGEEDFEDVSTASNKIEIGGLLPWNRYTAARAKKLDIPLRAIALPDTQRDGIVPPADVLDEFLAHERPVAPQTVAHLFRYPEQGSAHWLRQTRYEGEPWAAQQIVITPADDETGPEAVDAVLRKKLAFLGGEINDQKISVDMHLCDRIDILLRPGMVDFSKNVVVLVNGTQRFDEVPQRNIETLLDEARATWDFDRPVALRLRVTPAGRAIPY